MKKIIVLILSFITILTVAQDQDQPTKAPDIKTFALQPDAAGALANSVNLFTDDVNLPLNLISMPGHNGLDVNVSIFYSSNVWNIVNTWNVEAPTGILGLGWALDLPKIIVDNKMTGARDDDEFYLVEGGVSNRLIRTGTEGTVGGADEARLYESKNYNFWKIRYFPTTEKWEIIRENGIKYIYGDKESSRNTVQYLIKWGNWIGNSALASGQENQAFAWNLSEIKNMWNESIKFSYQAVEEKVGSGTLTYTQASYLEKITDVIGRTVEFFYGGKTTGEYQDSHTELTESAATNTYDAYQEHYETKFLDYILVKDMNSSLLFTIDFEYDSNFINAVDVSNSLFNKRTLISITQKDRNGKVLPNMKFAYRQNDIPVNVGALETVTYPQGGSVKYVYKLEIPAKSNRHLQINAPSSGYGEPRVWIEDDYVVVTWREMDYGSIHVTGNRNVKVKIYTWDGEWVQASQEYDIPDISVRDGSQSFDVRLNKNFFVIYDSNPKWANYDYGNSRAFIFEKDEKSRGQWLQNSFIISSSAKKIEVSLGDKFAVLNYKKRVSALEEVRIAETITKRGSVWLREEISQTSNSDVSGANNYFIQLDLGNKLKFYYLNELMEWKLGHESIIASTYPNNYFHLMNSFALLMLDGGGEMMWDWNDNYGYRMGLFILGAERDESPVYNLNNCLSGIVNDYDFYGAFVHRYDGSEWDRNTLISNSTYKIRNHYAFGDDIALSRDIINTSGTNSYYYLDIYNPNTLLWNRQKLPFAFSFYPLAVVGANFFAVDGKSYYRKPEGWINLGVTYLPQGGYIEQGLSEAGATFYTYRVNVNGYEDNKVQLFKNGTFGKYYSIGGKTYNGIHDNSDFKWMDKSNLVGANTFLTYNVSENILRDVRSFTLHRVVNDKIIYEQVHYVVDNITLNDGGTSNYTIGLKYDSDKTTIDPTGNTVKHNKVTVVQGYNPSSPTATPYGSTVTYFFNGLPTSDLLSFPIDNTFSNAGTNYSLLSGLPYKTEVYNSYGTLVSSTKNYYWVEEKPLNTQKGYYSRLKKTVNSIDGIETVNESTYDLNTGLVKESKTYNSTPLGGEETLTTSYKYFWEQYNTDRSLNLLTPVIQTIKKNNGTTIGASATTWTNSLWGLQSTQWVPHKTYKLVKSSTAQFNFASPTDDWQKILEVTSFDAAHGNVLETVDAENIYAAVKYGYQSTLPVAAIKNGRAGDINVVDLEEGIAAGWSGSGLITNDGHTGKKGYSGSLNATITTSGNYKYVVSGWVKADPQTTAPNLSASGVTKNYSGSGNWEYIELVVASSGSSVISVSANNGGAACTWDDIRIYPAIASLTTTTYDPTTLQVTSTTNSNGVTGFNEYDTFGRLIRTLNDNGEIMSEQSSYLSREVNSAFTFSDPNVSESVNFLNGYLAKNWNYENIEVQSGKVLPVNWLSNDFNNVEISYDNYLGRRGGKFKNGVGNSNYLFQKIGLISSGKTYTASVWFKAPSGSEGKLFFGDAGAPYDYDNSKSVILPGNNGWQKLTVTHTMTHADEMYVFVYGTSGEVIYDGVIVEEGTTTSEPLVSKTYSDGLGRNLQTHTRNAEANKVSVSAIGYDAIGRAYRNYKTYELNYPSTYDANYSTNAGLYSETEYYTDPLSRTKYSKPLGASSNAEWITTNYGSALISNKSYLYVQSESKIGANNNLIKTRTYSDLQGRTIRSAEVKFVGDVEVDFDYIVETKYNIYGQVESVKDPMGLTSSYVYDFKGNKTKVTVPDKSTFDGTTSTPVPSEYVYDKTNKLRFMVTPEGRQQNHVLYWKYDNLGRIIEKGYFNGTWNGSTYQTYADSDPAYPTGITTWRNKYYYDEDIDGMHSTIRGRVYKILSNNDVDNSEEIEETFRYDKYGNVLEKSTRALDYSKTSYSANYEYNKAGNVLKNSCGIISTLLLSNKTEDDIVNPVVYEAANKIEAGTSYIVQNNSNVTLQAGKSIALKPGFHALSGSKFKASVVSSLAEMNTETVVVYTYDSHGNLKTVGTTSNPSLYASYTYDKNGAVSYERLNNSSITNTYTYDNLNRLASINGGGNFGETLDYTNYYFGGIAKATYNNGESYIHYYQYDDYGRLKSTDEGAPGSSSVNILNITYDKNGNIETLNDGTLKDYVYYPSTNKLRNTNGTASNNYTYDANGNMTFSVSKTLSMIYDPFTQMTSSINSSSYNVNLQYTADNERVIKNETGTGYLDKTLYLRGMNEYPLVEKHTDITQPDNVYIYGASGLIAVKNSGKTYFIIKDHLGSTRAVVDGATNSPATRYNYLPFGGLKDIASNNITNYRFTGQEADELIGLYNFRARMYDPELGIFLGIDPAGQGFAPFAYAGNNPVIVVDKDGKFWHIVIGAVLGGVINTVAHAKQIKNLGDAFAAFGIGAVAGAVAAATGGAALAAYGGTAVAGSGGFAAGAASGFFGYSLSSPLLNFGNMTYFGDEPLSLKEYGIGIFTSTLTGGLVNGTVAALNGKTFWNGNNVSVPDATSTISTQTGKGLSDLEVATRYNEANGTVNKLYHYTTKANASSISEQGLNLSKDGFLYTTPKGDLTPIQAQIELSLSPNKGLPDALFKIDVRELNRIGVNPVIGPRSVFGGMFGAGGGKEVLFNQKISSQYLYRIK